MSTTRLLKAVNASQCWPDRQVQVHIQLPCSAGRLLPAWLPKGCTRPQLIGSGPVGLCPAHGQLGQPLPQGLQAQLGTQRIGLCDFGVRGVRCRAALADAAATPRLCHLPHDSSYAVSELHQVPLVRCCIQPHNLRNMVGNELHPCIKSQPK